MTKIKDLDIKNQLYTACSDYVNNRIEQTELNIRSMQQDLLTETKSSAGDKHETGRAMIHLEIEKSAFQIDEMRKTRALLEKVKIKNASDKIKMGSLVLTDQGKYFISISAGEIRIGTEMYYAVSPSSPIGNLLLGQTAGASIQLQNRVLVILEVL